MQCVPNVILDLDETIIHAIRHEPINPKLINSFKQHIITIGNAGNAVNIQIVERPFLQEFLDFLFENFNVGVWTAAKNDYALEVVRKIVVPPGREKSRKLMFVYSASTIVRSNEIIHSESCPNHFVQAGGQDRAERSQTIASKEVKDLEYIFKYTTPFNFHRCNTILIDDNAEAFKKNMNNTLLIQGALIPKFLLLPETTQEAKVHNMLMTRDQVLKDVQQKLGNYTEYFKIKTCDLNNKFTGCEVEYEPIFYGRNLQDYKDKLKSLPEKQVIELQSVINKSVETGYLQQPVHTTDFESMLRSKDDEIIKLRTELSSLQEEFDNMKDMYNETRHQLRKKTRALTRYNNP